MTAVRRRLGPRRKSISLWVTLTLMAAALVLVIPAAASHPEVSLADSDFEIDTNANLVVDDAGNLDWENVDSTVQPDKDSGAGDDSFGQGTKEDTAVPTVVSGSIPPNKSDLLTFGVYLEENADGKFLNLFWHRVQEPSGTTNMDFEFNKLKTKSGNGITPARSAGDLLIQYDLAGGGTHPELFVSEWVTTGNKSLCEAANSTPCWGDRVNLTDSGDATGSINTSAIDADDAIPGDGQDSLGDISPRTFGEAQLDFDALAEGDDACVSFGSAYLKSRSSDSFTAALKDFIAPTEVDLSNCGSVKIHKQDDAGTALAGAEFTLYNDIAPIGGSRGAEDTITNPVLKCTTDAAGDCTIDPVFQGEYWVVETVTPSGHDTAADQHVTVVADEEVSLTFVDPRQTGAILITKTRKHAADGTGDHPHAGVTFTITGGATDVTDANGEACFDGLLFGEYTVTETTPAGYDGEDPKTVNVDNAASCDDDPYGGEEVSFSNTPLSDITVSFSSQVPGGTAAQISCTGQAATPPDGTPSLFDDTSETFDDLLPGTYNCTVVIDP